MREKEIKIRLAAEKDVGQLLEIYAPYVKSTAITFEYEVPAAEEFAARMRHVQRRYPYFAAEAGDEIVGYAYAGAFGSRAAYDWSVETSIYVKMDRKGLGIGRKLYDALEGALAAQGILNLNACIAYAPEEDEYLTQASVRFHEKLGYRLAGHFHQCGYKFARWYDMVWMEKHIGSHRKDQPPARSFEEIKDRMRNAGSVTS